MTWDQWLVDIEKRERAFVNHIPLDTIERQNVHMLQRLMDGLVKKCGNPFCRQPIRHVRDRDYSAPGHGEICATCNDMHQAISILNVFLKNCKYFYQAHDAWEKEIIDEKEKRRKMGLDEHGIA